MREFKAKIPVYYLDYPKLTPLCNNDNNNLILLLRAFHTIIMQALKCGK